LPLELHHHSAVSNTS